MNLTLHRSGDFNRDFDLQYRWYLEQAGEAIAERFLQALLNTLRLLAAQPGLGASGSFGIQLSGVCGRSGWHPRLKCT